MKTVGPRATEKKKFDRGLAHILRLWTPTDDVPLDDALKQCQDKAAAARTAGRTNTGCLYEALAEVYGLYLRIVAKEERTTLNAWCFHRGISTAPKTCPLRALVKLARLAVTTNGTIDDKKSAKYAQALRYAVIRKIVPDGLVDFVARKKGGIETRARQYRSKFPTHKARKGKTWKVPKIVFSDQAREALRDEDLSMPGQPFLMVTTIGTDGTLTVLGCAPDMPLTKTERRHVGLPATQTDVTGKGRR